MSQLDAINLIINLPIASYAVPMVVIAFVCLTCVVTTRR
jgi:hypothetical protein